MKQKTTTPPEYASEFSYSALVFALMKLGGEFRVTEADMRKAVGLDLTRVEYTEEIDGTKIVRLLVGERWRHYAPSGEVDYVGGVHKFQPYRPENAPR